MRWPLLLFAVFIGCKRPEQVDHGKKILNIAARTKIGTLDPVRCSSQYDNVAVSMIFEPLFEYAPADRPYRLEPNLLESMPETSTSALSYTFTLKKGVHFHDDPAFENGKGREVTAADVIYSIKRMADRSFQPSGWWIYNQHIAGFDDFKRAQPINYETPVAGLQVLDRHRFRINLTKPFPQLLNVLATCYASVVAREVVEKYGPEIGMHPVGTGPFVLKELSLGTKVVLERNPKYRLPTVDGVVMHVFEQDQPMWLKWRAGDIDFIQVPAEYFDELFDEKNQLRESYVKNGVHAVVRQKLDFIFRGFNMEDPIVGGFQKGKLVRQAISLAMDTGELIEAFYNRTASPYDGPIPPALEGHKPGVISAYRGPSLELAKKKLAEAGYPDGQGLPPIEYHTNRGGNSPEQGEMVARQLKKAGITINLSSHSFPELEEMVKKRKAQMFNMSWGSDYPDAENNLALFYGPNAEDGSSYFNYKNPVYDELYRRASVLPSSPERTALYEKMRDLIIEDCPAIGSMARTRFYVANARVKNFYPDETWHTWIKYVGLDAKPE